MTSNESARKYRLKRRLDTPADGYDKDYNASLELVESINDKYRSIDGDRGKLQKHRLMMQARLEEMRTIQSCHKIIKTVVGVY